MAFAQFGKASGENWAIDLAKETFANIEKRKDNPKGRYAKVERVGWREVKEVRGRSKTKHVCRVSLELAP